MIQLLNDIFKLEDEKRFNEAFAAYIQLYKNDPTDYVVWKHFYFFLWLAIEDAPENFHERVNSRQLMQEMLNDGKKHFSSIADFNFIAGYTVSIFPYEYGDYVELEKGANEMLHIATKLEQDNLIYRLVYLGSIPNVNHKLYRQAEIDSAPEVLKTFDGNGGLNKYFKQILYRLDKPANP